MLEQAKVRDAMSTEVIEVLEDATLEAAARKMAVARVNSLIVRPEGKEDPFGIVTSTDVVDALADGLDLAETRVSEVATAPLVTVTPGVPIAYAARLMRRTNLRHLAVFNGREVVGVLSAVDVVKAIAKLRGWDEMSRAEWEVERTSVAER
ncbi:MAG: CBS domain-containing protein [Methanobacteriota archaeon]